MCPGTHGSLFVLVICMGLVSPRVHPPLQKVGRSCLAQPSSPITKAPELLIICARYSTQTPFQSRRTSFPLPISQQKVWNYSLEQRIHGQKQRGLPLLLFSLDKIQQPTHVNMEPNRQSSESPKKTSCVFWWEGVLSELGVPMFEGVPLISCFF